MNGSSKAELGNNSFRVGNLAQLVGPLVMYCWQLGGLYQGPGFEFH